jgi:hypothetical protein
MSMPLTASRIVRLFKPQEVLFISNEKISFFADSYWSELDDYTRATQYVVCGGIKGANRQNTLTSIAPTPHKFPKDTARAPTLAVGRPQGDRSAMLIMVLLLHHLLVILHFSVSVPWQYPSIATVVPPPGRRPPSCQSWW